MGINWKFLCGLAIAVGGVYAISKFLGDDDGSGTDNKFDFNDLEKTAKTCSVIDGPYVSDWFKNNLKSNEYYGLVCKVNSQIGQMLGIENIPQNGNFENALLLVAINNKTFERKISLVKSESISEVILSTFNDKDFFKVNKD